MARMIGGYPIYKMARNVGLAILGGFICGKCTNNFRSHPGEGTKVLYHSALAGAVCTCAGICIGIWKGHQVVLPAMVGGLQGSLGLGAFLSLRSLISHQEFRLPGKSHCMNEVQVSAVSGGTCGVLSGVFLWRGPVVMLGATSVGILGGFLGHLVYRQLMKLRYDLLLQYHYPDLVLEKRQLEKYIREQESSNIEYRGPSSGSPGWMAWLSSFMEQSTASSKIDHKLSELEIELKIIKEEQNKYASLPEK